MSFWTPPSLHTIPADGDWDGELGARGVDGAVVHPALLVAPQRSQEFPLWMPGIPGTWDAPPPSVLAAAFARRWLFSCSLTSPGVSYVVTDEEVDDTVSNWRGAFRESRRALWNELREGSVCDDSAPVPNWMQLAWTVGRSGANVRIRYDWESELWWPALALTVTCRDFCGSFPAESGNVGVGSSYYDDSVADVAVEFCGVSIPTRLSSVTSGRASISGWIRIDPIDWLDVI